VWSEGRGAVCSASTVWWDRRDWRYRSCASDRSGSLHIAHSPWCIGCSGRRPRRANIAASASKYYSRGWTFQESNFATRSLVFIDGKVAFSCQRTDTWEGHLTETADEIRGRDIGNRGIWFSDDIGEAEGMTQTYSERELSCPSDVLNAFARASRQLVYQLDTDLCHGIPTAYFDWFLLWFPLKDQIRRADPHPLTPSWSWAGWIGPSWPRIWDWYNRSIRRIRKAIRQRTCIIWYHRVPFSSPECVLLIRRHLNPVRRFKPTKNFYGARIREDRFPGLDCSRVEPTRNLALVEPRTTSRTPSPKTTRARGFCSSGLSRLSCASRSP